MDNNPSSQRMADFSRRWCECEKAVRLYFAAMLHQNPSDIPDLVQKTAIAAFKKFDSYDTNRPFKAWILGFACYEVLAFKRDVARSREYADSEAVDTASAVEQHNPEREYRHQLLHRAIAKLPDNEQQMLKMQYVQQRSMAEISGELKMNEGALRTALSRVRDKLRRIMTTLEREDNQ